MEARIHRGFWAPWFWSQPYLAFVLPARKSIATGTLSKQSHPFFLMGSCRRSSEMSSYAPLLCRLTCYWITECQKMAFRVKPLIPIDTSMTGQAVDLHLLQAFVALQLADWEGSWSFQEHPHVPSPTGPPCAQHTEVNQRSTPHLLLQGSGCLIASPQTGRTKGKMQGMCLN